MSQLVMDGGYESVITEIRGELFVSLQIFAHPVDDLYHSVDRTAVLRPPFHRADLM